MPKKLIIYGAYTLLGLMLLLVLWLDQRGYDFSDLEQVIIVSVLLIGLSWLVRLIAAKISYKLEFSAFKANTPPLIWRLFINPLIMLVAIIIPLGASLGLYFCMREFNLI